jgi:dienelactone hydrolase
MKVRKLIINHILIMAIMIIYTSPQAEVDHFPFSFGLEKGDYDVGFKIVTIEDHSRPVIDKFDSLGNITAKRARPVRPHIWYPAKYNQNDMLLSYGEYLQLDNDKLRVFVEKARAMEMTDANIQIAIDNMLNTTVPVVRNADQIKGQYPLLIFSPGGNTPGYMYSSMCEYLASHGYIAVTLPSYPKTEGERWPFNQVGIHLQIQDLSLTINHMYSWSNVDRNKLGFVSWSVGGVSQALTQMQNTDVDAFVSIDGATGYLYGIQMIRESVLFDSSAVTIPYYHAHGNAPAQYEVTKDFSYYDSLVSSDAFLLTFDNLNHSNFRSQAVVEDFSLNVNNIDLIVNDYKILCESVLAFLDAYIKFKQDAKTQLMEFEKLESITVYKKE